MAESREITFEGRTMSSAAWAKEMDLKPAVLRQRLKAGWSPYEAFGTPHNQRRVQSGLSLDGKHIEFRGRRQTAIQWSIQTGISAEHIRKRLDAGWSAERALTLGSWAHKKALKKKRREARLKAEAERIQERLRQSGTAHGFLL